MVPSVEIKVDLMRGRSLWRTSSKGQNDILPPPPRLSREISQNLLFKDASLGALLKSISHAGVGTLEGLISPQAGRVEH